MFRRPWLMLAGAAVALAATPSLLAPQRPASRAPPRAASQRIATQAAVVDRPDVPGAERRQHRAGANGWVCVPSTPPSAAAGATDPLATRRTADDRRGS